MTTQETIILVIATIFYAGFWIVLAILAIELIGKFVDACDDVRAIRTAIEATLEDTVLPEKETAPCGTRSLPSSSSPTTARLRHLK
jgi:hypothetical protein